MTLDNDSGGLKFRCCRPINLLFIATDKRFIAIENLTH